MSAEPGGFPTDRRSRGLRPKLLPLGLVLLVGTLLASDGYLVVKNRQLAAGLQLKYAALQVAPGATVPPLRGKTLDGRDVTIAWGGVRDHLLMLFTPGCGFCSDNWANWEIISRRVNHSKLSLVLVQLSGHMTQQELRGLGFVRTAFIAQIDPADVAPFRLRLVPQTILVGSDDRVMRVWSGVLQPSEVSYILAKYGKSGVRTEEAK